MSPPSLPHDAITRDELWQTLGRLSSGVCILTATHDGGHRGMTASAVIGLSHEPPTLGVAVRHDRKMHALLSRPEVTHFGLNVLSSTQKKLSEHFAGKPDPALPLAWFEHEGLPLLGGTIAQIVCRKDQALTFSDHTLFTGLIEYTRFTDDDPLVYFRGQYHELG
ncbi:flavin reductase family protein [Deinococcus fonticola]|uniref:flavin reductase family protein n=1 Tax=Deinococcus fonticola TaxID=2528713 RepID=UPI0010751755|nr:flavin reductase family protein [Deinococcus fonticola]